MSRYTDIAVVPFKISVGELSGSLKDAVNQSWDDNDETVNGWTAFFWAADYGDLIVNAVMKNPPSHEKLDCVSSESWAQDLPCVFIVNEHDDACVGGEDWCFCACQKPTLIEFMHDMNIDGKIEENVAVKQTL